MEGFHSGLSRVPLLLPADSHVMMSAADHASHVIKSEAEFQAAMDSLGSCVNDHVTSYNGGGGGVSSGYSSLNSSSHSDHSGTAGGNTRGSNSLAVCHTGNFNRLSPCSDDSSLAVSITLLK